MKIKRSQVCPPAWATFKKVLLYELHTANKLLDPLSFIPANNHQALLENVAALTTVPLTLASLNHPDAVEGVGWGKLVS